MFGSFSDLHDLSVFKIFRAVFRFLVGPITLLLVFFFPASLWKTKENARLIPTPLLDSSKNQNDFAK